jgi:AAA domain, putative AbiEii toxin, Type IV TA system/AAA ATPase domain
MNIGADSVDDHASSEPYDGGTDYDMISSADIKNFRAFEHITVSGFKTINLILGDNGAGKTALLEALVVASSNSPAVAAAIYTWRGLSMGNVAQPREQYEAIFGSLFFKLQKNRVGEIVLRGTGDDSRTVRFYTDKTQPVLLQVAGAAASAASQNYEPVTFEFRDQRGAVTLTPRIQSGGILLPPGPHRATEPTFMPARAPFNQAEIATWYSELSKRGEEKKFFEAMKSQFPEIEAISLELEGGAPIVFARIEGSPLKMQTALISDGMTKLMSIFLRLAHSAGTATFFDELENGLHFSRHERLWGQLLNFASDYKTQIFASTHSWEFIESALPMMKQKPDDFSVTRVHWDRKNDKRIVRLLSGKEAIPLIESGIELRD